MLLMMKNLKEFINHIQTCGKIKTKILNFVLSVCPHLTLTQALKWHDDIKETLKYHKVDKVCCNVVLTIAPKVKEKLIKEHKEIYDDFNNMGVNISSICPLMYTNNPLVHKKAIITNSNKLRTYSMARYFKDEDILKLIAGERIY